MEILNKICNRFKGRDDETFSSDEVGDTLVRGSETYYRVRSTETIFNTEGVLVDPCEGEAVLVTGKEADAISRRMDKLKALGRR